MLKPASRSGALLRCLSNRSSRTNYSKHQSGETVDEREVNKFDKFSTDQQYNWYTSELTRPLRNLNNLRVPLIKGQLLAERQYRKEPIDQRLPLDGIRLLDIGCGGGLLSECLARLGAHVTAIDANENNIRFAKEHLALIDQSITGRLDYVHSHLDQLGSKPSGSTKSGSTKSSSTESGSSQSSGQFDGIVASEILEHVNSVQAFIGNCSSLLKENGLLFVTTINQTAQAYLAAILLAENVLNLAPKNTHQYDKLVLLNGLSLLLEESKCFSICLITW